MSSHTSQTRGFRRFNSRRTGSTLALCVSIGLALILIALFVLALNRIFGSHNEQDTAAESAALAAAKAMSRIVLSDPVFGYVGLLDAAPEGTVVAAPDGYGVSVRSINSLLATARLDMIIADKLGNTLMKTLAVTDYRNAQVSASNLQKALQDSILQNPANKYTDKDGTAVTVYKDAEEAYETNVVRMQGASRMQPGSLRLTLGFSKGIDNTLTPIPSDAGVGAVSSSQESNGFYSANQNIAYDGYSFEFTAISNQTTLVPSSSFVSVADTQINAVPSAILAAANQNFGHGSNGYCIQDKACALAGGGQDVRPAPGSLVLNFPTGCPAEFSTMQELIANSNLSSIQFHWSLPSGDYPNSKSTLTPIGYITYPNLQAIYKAYFANNCSTALSLALYEWLRRAGPFLDVQAAVNMMNTQFWPSNAALNAGLMICVNVDTTRGTANFSVLYDQTIYATGSDSQLVGVSGNGIEIPSQAQAYTLVIVDNVHLAGKAGGLHGGEPIVDNRLTHNPLYGTPYTPPIVPAPNTAWPCLGWDGPSGGWAYNQWDPWHNIYAAGGDNTVPPLQTQPQASTVGQIRPTYNTNGLAVEITLHRTMRQVPYVPPSS